MANRKIVAVTRDAEIYHIANITECTDAHSIRRLILSQLRVPEAIHSNFTIYRAELGGPAFGDALDDDQLLLICQQLGDGIGSLKFIIQNDNNSIIAHTNTSPSQPLHMDTINDRTMPQLPHQPTPNLSNMPHPDQMHAGNNSRASHEITSPGVLSKDQHNPFTSTVTSKNLEQAGIRWAKGSLIGRSAYGRTYHGWIINGEMIAVKQVDLPQSERDREDSTKKTAVRALWNECDILSRLTHPNIVRFLGFEKTVDTLSMFLEYIPGGHIAQLLQDYGKLEDETIRFFSRQIVDGLAYIHASGVIHCNLKYSNVLVTELGVCRIFAFSVSEQNENAYRDYRGTRMQGSIYWMAPEMIHNDNQLYNAKVDIWSLGCTITEMQSGQRPWPGEDAVAVLYKVGANREAPTIPKDIMLAPLAVGFQQECFHPVPAKRPTATGLLLHPWLVNSPGWTFKKFGPVGPDQPSPQPTTSHKELPEGFCTDSKSDIDAGVNVVESKDQFLSTAAIEISSSMPSVDIIRHLVSHGCQDLTADLDLLSFSEYPISSGGFGDVYRGKLKNGQRVAVKCMRFIDTPFDEEERRKDLKHAAREIHTWSRLQHPNVLRLLGLVGYRSQIGMLSLWVERGPIRNYIAQNPTANRLDLCTKITDGLSYLHESGVVHGDLKGDNVLISDIGEPLLTDFGNAVLQERTLQFTCTTTKTSVSLRWAAPELLGEGGPCNARADIFALGMTILEVITNDVPYVGIKDIAVTFAIVQHRLPKRPEAHIPTNSKHGNFLWLLLNCCWDPDPNKRPTAIQVRHSLRLILDDDLIDM